jgi:hypothetical protein
MQGRQQQGRLTLNSRDASRTQGKTELYRDVNKQQGRLQQHGCLYHQGDANSQKSYEIMKNSFKEATKKSWNCKFYSLMAFCKSDIARNTGSRMFVVRYLVLLPCSVFIIHIAIVISELYPEGSYAHVPLVWNNLSIFSCRIYLQICPFPLDSLNLFLYQFNLFSAHKRNVKHSFCTVYHSYIIIFNTVVYFINAKHVGNNISYNRRGRNIVKSHFGFVYISQSYVEFAILG